MGIARRVSGARLLATVLSGALPCAASAGQAVTLALSGPDGRPAPGVAVYLPGVTAPAAGGPVVVDQRNEAFVPAVTVVQAGSDVQFTNSDPTSHHVYSFSRPNAFALPLYKGNEALTQRFARPGVVVLGCNIHDSMLGYVVVVDSTRHGVTGPDGRVTLADVPAGTHPVRAWAPGLDRARPPVVGAVTVTAAAPASVALQLPVAGAKAPRRKSTALVGGDY
jgi:plastocyanin